MGTISPDRNTNPLEIRYKSAEQHPTESQKMDSKVEMAAREAVPRHSLFYSMGGIGGHRVADMTDLDLVFRQMGFQLLDAKQELKSDNNEKFNPLEREMLDLETFYIEAETAELQKEQMKYQPPARPTTPTPYAEKDLQALADKQLEDEGPSGPALSGASEETFDIPALKQNESPAKEAISQQSNKSQVENVKKYSLIGSFIATCYKTKVKVAELLKNLFETTKPARSRSNARSSQEFEVDDAFKEIREKAKKNSLPSEDAPRSATVFQISKGDEVRYGGGDAYKRADKERELKQAVIDYWKTDNQEVKDRIRGYINKLEFEGKEEYLKQLGIKDIL